MTQTIITTTFPIYTHGNPDAAMTITAGFVPGHDAAIVNGIPTECAAEHEMTITAEFVPGHDAAIMNGIPTECASNPEFEIESVIVDGIEIDGIIDDEFAECFWYFDHNRKTYVRHNRRTLIAEIEYQLTCEL